MYFTLFFNIFVKLTFILAQAHIVVATLDISLHIFLTLHSPDHSSSSFNNPYSYLIIFHVLKPFPFLLPFFSHIIWFYLASFISSFSSKSFKFSAWITGKRKVLIFLHIKEWKLNKKTWGDKNRPVWYNQDQFIGFFGSYRLTLIFAVFWPVL